MKRALTLSATAIVIILVSCRRDSISSPVHQAIPKLKYSITKDSAGRITNTSHFNEWGLSIADTAFSTQTGKESIWTSSEYNSKGKRTKYTLYAPVFTPTGYHWMDIDEYVDDTLPVMYRHFLHGTQTLWVRKFYNSSKQLVLDSTFNSGSIILPYAWKYTYDLQGRILTKTRFNELNDTVVLVSLQYSTNHTEEITTNYYYNPANRSSSKVVKDYNATGNLLSQRTYSPLTQLSMQTDYTYDVNGILVKEITTDMMSGNKWESRYTNNSFGRPDKKENYYQNKATTTVYYYYE